MFWDPPREIFTIPLIGRPVVWYGLLFALGVWLGYQIALWRVTKLCGDKRRAIQLCERLALYVIVGCIVGAKVGHVLFYEPWMAIKSDPLMLVRFWEEGLASHGAVLGILIGLAVFAKKIKIGVLAWIDVLAIPACIAGAFIRFGNFVNQEILGVKCSMPWAVTFGHPIDGSMPLARHPVQLYEAFGYLAIGYMISFAWQKENRQGFIAGLFFVSLFAFRFCMEFFKERQSALLGDGNLLTMGQYLSVPLIALGLYLMRKAVRSGAKLHVAFD